MDVDVGRYVETHSHITTDVGRYDKAQLECGVISQPECALNAPHLSLKGTGLSSVLSMRHTLRHLFFECSSVGVWILWRCLVFGVALSLALPCALCLSPLSHTRCYCTFELAFVE